LWRSFRGRRQRRVAAARNAEAHPISIVAAIDLFDYLTI
jgi:hypothetical protein